MDWSELQVEHERVGSGRGVDAEPHDPPATHIELQPFDEMITVAQRARHARFGRQAVSVLWHAAVNGRGDNYSAKNSVHCCNRPRGIESPSGRIVAR